MGFLLVIQNVLVVEVTDSAVYALLVMWVELLHFSLVMNYCICFDSVEWEFR